jgi:hypothetical protein
MSLQGYKSFLETRFLLQDASQKVKTRKLMETLSQLPKQQPLHWLLDEQLDSFKE